MRIRRQALAPPSSQGARAANSSNGTVSPSASADLKNACFPQQGPENVHFSTGNLSMIYSASKFRASVNWLDRLRAAKGIPVDGNMGIDEALSSRTCSSEEIQCRCLEEGASPSLKQESEPNVDAVGLLCKNTGNKQCRAPESSSYRTLASDIKNSKVALRSLSRRNGTAEVESLRSHTFGEHSSLALRVQDVCNESGNAEVDASYCQSLREPPSSSSIVAADNIIKKDSSKCSRSTLIQKSSPQDSLVETTISRLYYNVFADLFCMESCDTNCSIQADAKRRHRKQENPKVCSTFADLDPVLPTDTSPHLQICEFDKYPSPVLDLANPTSQSEVDAVVKTDMPSSSPEVQGVEVALNQPKKAPYKVSKAESKTKVDVEQENLSKSDLFIIDTSLSGWRTKKVISRRGNGWKIQSAETSFSATVATAECVVKDETIPENIPLSSSSKLRKQWESQICIGKNPRTDIDQTQSSNADGVGRIWNIAPHTHIRSSRKRRKSTLVAGPSIEIVETICPDMEPLRKITGFAPDHPANQPKEGLAYSIYQVFMQAGKSGLTPREAVTRILEQGLPGLQEGGVVPRVEVLKVISNSPYFMPLEESKFILCSALVGDEEIKFQCKPDRQMDTQDEEPQVDKNGSDCIDNIKPARQHGMSQYWAACAAIRRARTAPTRRKPSIRSYFLNPMTSDMHEDIAYLANKKRLKSVRQDVTGLGNPCNRSDGKGWHCPLRAKVGYLLCDHHLDRLRTRVKSHIKSKMLSVTKGTKEERKRIFADSWMVNKVVERSHEGGHSIGGDIQGSFPDCLATASSVSKVS